MSSPGQNFKKSLNAWATKAGDKLEALARQSVQETAFLAVQGTPVDTGYLRGNWQPAIGAPVAKVAPVGSIGEPGSRITLTVSQFKTGQRFYFTNATRYARAQEYGTANMEGRFYVQAAVKRWRMTVQKVANELGLGK